MKKVALGIAGLLVITIVVGFVVFAKNLDAIVKIAIEEIGSEVLGTTVEVSEVKLELTDGKGQISGIKVMNPNGFSNAAMLELDNMALDLDLSTITGPVYVINNILIDGVKVLAEQRQGTTNFQIVLDNLDRMTTASDESAVDPAVDSAQEVLFAIGKFTFENSSAKLVSDQLGEYALDVPGIGITSLGTKENPLTVEQVGSQALNQLFQQITQAVSSKAEDLVKDVAVDKAMERVSEKDKAKIEGALKLFGK